MHTVPVVAYVDSLGYLRCTKCADSADACYSTVDPSWKHYRVVKHRPIKAKVQPHCAEDCDFCHRPVSGK